MSCDMWFGTREFSTWVPTPLSGADVSPRGWNTSGTLLGGDGYAIGSYNTHKTYNFSWRSTSARETAQLMKSFYSGSYGRGKLYFIDPLTYDTNVLPARWADPSITCGFEGQSLVPGVEPAMTPASGFESLRLPVHEATYRVPDGTTQGDPFDTGLYLPIPEGYILVLRSFHTAPNGANAPGVWVAPVSLSGVGTPSQILPSGKVLNTNADPGVSVVTRPPGTTGALLWIGAEKRGDSFGGTLSINAMEAFLVPLDRANTWAAQPHGYWVGGQGNAGVRFEEPPTYINHTGVDGGQVEFSASFIESVL